MISIWYHYNLWDFCKELIKVKQKLIDKINNLSKEQISKCFKLLDTIDYPDDVHKSEILSLYLQKKAIDLILLTKRKPDSDALNIIIK